MTKKEKMYARIEKHGNELLAIFPKATEKNPVELCKKLFRIENKTHCLATQYCNGFVDTEKWEIESEKLEKKAMAILNSHLPIFANGDARGYGLKIEPEHVKDLKIYKDFGGYGIIAPDFRE